ncbi:MAG: VWA domain-containing protein [Planctomycetes bacterium]|nr:VWA domain-containing protein [Planctomycetota bacterium]
MPLHPIARSLALAFLATVLVAGLAQAQTTAGTPPAGGTTPPAGSNMDLPLETPKGNVDPEGDKKPPEDDNKDQPEFFGEEVPSESDSIVFVIDRSGSMGWDSKTFTGLDGSPKRGDRMTRAKTELMRSIGQLTENFKFNIVAYDCSIIAWKSNGTEKATDANKAAAFAWIQRLDPDGGTMTGPGTARGLELDRDNKLVVLLTDGDPNCGANGHSGHKGVIKSANTQGAKVNVFGVGVDSGGFRGFLQAVAAENGGKYVDVP